MQINTDWHGFFANKAQVGPRHKMNSIESILYYILYECNDIASGMI